MQVKSQRTWIKNPLDCLDTAYAGGIVIQNDVIVELISAGEQPLQAVDEVVDAHEHVLIPGLINSHHHFYQTLTRAFPAALNKNLFPWLHPFLWF